MSTRALARVAARRDGRPLTEPVSRPMATPPAVLAVMRAARIICRTPRDAVMFAVHCTFMAEGYVLLAAGDNVDPMMFQEKEEEPDDGLPKRKPDPHVGWNDMDDEYAFKYCALADYDNTAQAPAPAHVGAILKAIFIGNTLMCHSMRTEDGGASWSLASYLGPEPEGYQIMPARSGVKLCPSNYFGGNVADTK